MALFVPPGRLVRGGGNPISANFIDNYFPVDGAPYSIGTEDGRANRGWTLK